MKLIISYFASLLIIWVTASEVRLVDEESKPAGVQAMREKLRSLPDRGPNDKSLKKKELYFLYDIALSDSDYKLAYEKGYRVLLGRSMDGDCYKYTLTKKFQMSKKVKVTSKKVDPAECQSYKCEGKGICPLASSK